MNIKIIYLYEWLKIKLHMLYLNIKFAQSKERERNESKRR